MGFLETQFPQDISYGSSCGPGHQTAVVQMDNSRSPISRQESALCQFDAKQGIREPQHVGQLIDFCRVMRGAFTGFRFKDWTDYTTGVSHIRPPTNADVIIAAGDGTTTTFQLLTQYVVAGVTRTRIIEKPVAGTVVVAVNGVAKTLGVDFTVNTTSGLITFASAPANNAVITAGCEFDVPVTFGVELDKLMAISLDAFEQNSIPSIPIIETRNETPVDDERFAGGAKALGPVAASWSITALDGFLITANPTSAGLVCTLPDPLLLPDGGPWFRLANESAVNPYTAKNHLAATVIAVPALGGATLGIKRDSGGNKVWLGWS